MFIRFDITGLEHDRPIDTVGLQDILCNKMLSRWPESLKSFSVRIPDGAYVVDQGVEPHVSHIVFIKGKGNSPLDLDLPLGKHEVRVNSPGHYEWEAQLQLREEGETPLFVRLIPMDDNNP